MATNPAQHMFSSEDELREFIGKPMDLAVAKAIDQLDKHCKAYIERSPFICIGTASADGQADVSPRGAARDSFRCSTSIRFSFQIARATTVWTR